MSFIRKQVGRGNCDETVGIEDTEHLQPSDLDVNAVLYHVVTRD